jgi:hypothetical protein
MTIAVTHSTPADASFSASGATAWDANHTLTGVGTMATQDANAIAITGGAINGTIIGATTASNGAFTYFSTSSTTSTTPVLNYNASNCNFAVGATIPNSYLQAVMQNKSGTATASTNWAVSNDLGTDSSYYGEFGMNSSGFSSGTPSDYFSLNNGIYFSGHDGDITIGSGNGFKTYLAWGTAGQSAHVINASGAIGLNTNITGTTNFGTSGQVLTSAGNAATPTWTTPATGTVTSVTGTAPVVSSGGATPAISMAKATTSVDGYLAAADFTTFNGKQATLVSGTNIKTVSGTSLLGSGDVGVIGATYGGTGVNNGSNTITIAGNLTHAGAFTQSFTASANTAVTLPAGATASSNNLLSSATAVGIVTGTPSSSNYLRGDGTWASPAGAGTVTSVDVSGGTTGLTTSGGPVTGSGTITLAGTLALANGGTGKTTASAANANLMGFTTTATAAGTTTLTNTSSYIQYFTGTSAQTIVMPVTSTLATGWSFHIANNSTVALTLQSSGANTIGTIAPNTTVHITCIGTALTTAADWDFGTTDFGALLGNDGTVPMSAQWYLSSAGSALSGTAQNFFGANSAVALDASSTYDIECYCYFLKSTAGTVQWIPTVGSAFTVGHSYLEYTPVTGFTTTVITGAMVTSEATGQTLAVLTHSATASLTTAVYHIAKLRIRITTNAATNFRLNNTIGTGSITPQAGSYYTARKVAINSGTFVA